MLLNRNKRKPSMSELNFMHENISGIYNYCDRWCEKCQYTNRCLLFKQEAEREIKYLLKDENVSDDEHFSKVLADEMKDAEKIFNQNPNAEEFFDSFEDDEDFEPGDDDDEYDDFLDEEDDSSTEGRKKEFNPLIKLSEEMFKELDHYYDVAKKHFPEEVEKYDASNPFIKNLQTLGWYIPQINVKIRMCYWGKKPLEKAKTKDAQAIEEEMLNVTSRIAYLGIENSMIALKEIFSMRKELEAETKLFLSTMKMVRKMFMEEFPNGQTYKRPYFD